MACCSRRCLSIHVIPRHPLLIPSPATTYLLCVPCVSGTLIDTFNHLSVETMTPSQREWVESIKLLIGLPLPETIQPPKNKYRRSCAFWCRHLLPPPPLYLVVVAVTYLLLWNTPLPHRFSCVLYGVGKGFFVCSGQAACSLADSGWWILDGSW